MNQNESSGNPYTPSNLAGYTSQETPKYNYTFNPSTTGASLNFDYGSIGQTAGIASTSPAHSSYSAYNYTPSYTSPTNYNFASYSPETKKKETEIAGNCVGHAGLEADAKVDGEKSKEINSYGQSSSIYIPKSNYSDYSSGGGLDFLKNYTSDYISMSAGFGETKKKEEKEEPQKEEWRSYLKTHISDFTTLGVPGQSDSLKASLAESVEHTEAQNTSPATDEKKESPEESWKKSYTFEPSKFKTEFSLSSFGLGTHGETETKKEKENKEFSYSYSGYNFNPDSYLTGSSYTYNPTQSKSENQTISAYQPIKLEEASNDKKDSHPIEVYSPSVVDQEVSPAYTYTPSKYSYTYENHDLQPQEGNPDVTFKLKLDLNDGSGNNKLTGSTFQIDTSRSGVEGNFRTWTPSNTYSYKQIDTTNKDFNDLKLYTAGYITSTLGIEMKKEEADKEAVETLFKESNKKQDGLEDLKTYTSGFLKGTLAISGVNYSERKEEENAEEDPKLGEGKMGLMGAGKGEGGGKKWTSENIMELFNFKKFVPKIEEKPEEENEPEVPESKEKETEEKHEEKNFSQKEAENFEAKTESEIQAPKREQEAEEETLKNENQENLEKPIETRDFLEKEEPKEETKDTEQKEENINSVFVESIDEDGKVEEITDSKEASHPNLEETEKQAPRLEENAPEKSNEESSHQEQEKINQRTPACEETRQEFQYTENPEAEKPKENENVNKPHTEHDELRRHETIDSCEDDGQALSIIPQKSSGSGGDILPNSALQEMQAVSETEPLEIHYEDGSTYYGHVINKKRNGKGRMNFASGGHYKGDWFEDHMEGEGTLFFKSGEVAYSGEWEESLFNGSGQLFNDNVQGAKEFNILDLINTMGESWAKFEGSFERDMKDGVGTLWFSDGSKFHGIFKNDFPNGMGTYYDSEGNHVISGKWKKGIFEEEY